MCARVGAARPDDAYLTACLKHYHSSRRESFSPRVFLRGEKVPKADEGGVYVNARFTDTGRDRVKASHAGSHTARARE